MKSCACVVSSDTELLNEAESLSVGLRHHDDKAADGDELGQ